jgi:hypothetical protein
MELLRKGCPPDKLTLYDTAVHGRPDLVDLATAAYQEQEAEAVFCVSNLEGTKQLVRGCRSRGIPAFGPIWDAWSCPSRFVSIVQYESRKLQGGGEKRKLFSEKPGEREKYFAPFFEISHTKSEKTVLWENWEILEKKKKRR